MEYNHSQNSIDIDNALSLGQDILQSLDKALDSLDSAKNWGLLDMFGGGFITSMIKHSKIDNANNELSYTKVLLRDFQSIVNSVHFIDDLYIELGSFATFADYFFDSLIADWFVQSKINENREKVQRVSSQVADVLDRLRKMKAYEQRFLPGN